MHAGTIWTMCNYPFAGSKKVYPFLLARICRNFTKLHETDHMTSKKHRNNRNIMETDGTRTSLCTHPSGEVPEKVHFRILVRTERWATLSTLHDSTILYPQACGICLNLHHRLISQVRLEDFIWRYVHLGWRRHVWPGFSASGNSSAY